MTNTDTSSSFIHYYKVITKVITIEETEDEWVVESIFEYETNERKPPTSLKVLKLIEYDQPEDVLTVFNPLNDEMYMFPWRNVIRAKINIEYISSKEVAPS